MRNGTHTLIGAAIGLGAETVRPLQVPVTLPPFLDVYVGTFIGPVIGGAILVLLGAFVARLPDLDLQVGLEHRGVTHSIAAAAFVTALAYLLVQIWMPAAALQVAAVTGAAYLSHLVADSVNPTPQALLWPLPAYRPGWLPSARENSLPGMAVEAIVWVAILGLIAWRAIRFFDHR